MTSHPHPAAGTLVELTANPEAVSPHEPVPGVRVVESDGKVVLVSLALADVPVTGAVVALRWPAGPRGRHVQSGRVTLIDENRVTIELAGQPELEQQRDYVRGGGGEQVLLIRPGHADTLGWIRDISEQAVRAHFTDVDLHDGAEITLRIALDPDLVELRATVFKAASIRQSLPRRGPLSVEMVAKFTPDETQAKVIRRYVLRQQMLNRGRTAIG